MIHDLVRVIETFRWAVAQRLVQFVGGVGLCRKYAGISSCFCVFCSDLFKESILVE